LRIQTYYSFFKTNLQMLQEFKEFIQKGNVLEFAVAVIMATAFGAIITTFTNDVLMPPIGLAMGGVDFNEIQYTLQAGVPAIIATDGKVVTEAVPEVAIKYGKWINTILNFLIIAFILFLVVRSYNKMSPPPPEEDAGPTQEDLLGEIRDLLKR